MSETDADGYEYDPTECAWDWFEGQEEGTWLPWCLGHHEWGWPAGEHGRWDDPTWRPHGVIA